MKLREIVFKFLRKEKVNNEIYCPIMQTDGANRLAGKNVVVTGASSGIGEAIAIKAAQEGAKVLLIGRREKKLKDIFDKNKERCIYLVSDVTKDTNLLEKCLKALDGKIDVFVNNAGIYIQHQGSYTEQDFDKTFALNIKAPYMLTQQYISYCRENCIKGNILMISSNRALFGDTTPYGLSKAAMNNMVKGFARNNANAGIRVNALCPGMVATEINNVDKTGNMYSGNPKFERILMPEEIAEVAIFLMSDVSQCINGAIIPCDGGDSLR